MFHSRFDSEEFTFPQRISIVLDKEEKTLAKIKIVGVGGGGCNAIDSMIKKGLTGVDFIAVNTDLQSLQECAAPVKVQIGKNLTRGLGAGSDVLIGESAVREDEERIRQLLSDSDMVIITSCFGGGTGTGAAPVIAEIAKGTQALVLAIITKPFKFEGKNRNTYADHGIEKIRESVDSLIIMKNDILYSLYGGGGSIFDMFDKPNEVLYDSAKGITEMIIKRGLINPDFADVKTAMKASGDTLIGSAKARGEKRAQEAAERAISCPLLEGVDIRGSRHVLVNVTGSDNMTAEEYYTIANIVSNAVGEDASIKFGVVYDEKMNEEISVTVIATGYKARIRHLNTGFTPQIDSSIKPKPSVAPTTANIHPIDPAINLNEINTEPDINQGYSVDKLEELDKPLWERNKKTETPPPESKKEDEIAKEDSRFMDNLKDATKDESNDLSKLLKKLMNS